MSRVALASRRLGDGGGRGSFPISGSRLRVFHVFERILAYATFAFELGGVFGAHRADVLVVVRGELDARAFDGCEGRVVGRVGVMR